MYKVPSISLLLRHISCDFNVISRSPILLGNPSTTRHSPVSVLRLNRTSKIENQFFSLHSIEAPSKKVISDSLNNNMVHYYMIQSVRVVSCVDAQRWLAFPSHLEPLNLSKKKIFVSSMTNRFFNDQNVLRRRRSLLKYFSLTHSSILIKVNDKSKKAIAMKAKYVCWGKQEEDEEWNNWQVFVVLLTCFFFCPRRERRNDPSLSSF